MCKPTPCCGDWSEPPTRCPMAEKPQYMARKQVKHRGWQDKWSSLVGKIRVYCATSVEETITVEARGLWRVCKARNLPGGCYGIGWVARRGSQPPAVELGLYVEGGRLPSACCLADSFQCNSSSLEPVAFGSTPGVPLDSFERIALRMPSVLEFQRFRQLACDRT